MLLRASRVAEQLTKEALVGKAIGALAGKTLSAVGRNPLKVLGGGLMAASVAPEISQGMQRSKVGLQPQYLEAANAGVVPSVPKF